MSPEPRTEHELHVDDEGAATVFEALSGECAREIFRALCEDPMPATDVADVVGTSLQNALYHLEKLERADLVEVVDTWYSTRGKEMCVYAARPRSIVIECVDDADGPASSPA